MIYSVHPGMTQKQLIRHRKKHVKNPNMSVTVITAMLCQEVVLGGHPLGMAIIVTLVQGIAEGEPIKCVTCDAEFRPSDSRPELLVAISQNKIGNIRKNEFVQHVLVCTECVQVLTSEEVVIQVRQVFKLKDMV